MKRTLLTLALIAGMATMVLADEAAALMSAGSGAAPAAGRVTLYTFFVNIVAEPFRFPLIGFFNMMLGSHTLPQIGFINNNTGDFATAQVGFVNTVGGNVAGMQTGFVNTVVGNTSGAQFGFINTSMGEVRGTQFGFVNTSASTTTGVHFGFVNISRGGVTGKQIGFVNTSLGNTTGMQLGMINTSRGKMRGPQLGFVNSTAGVLNGVQFGFFNFVDSIEEGIPIGFISIVRHGGFRAVEYTFSEFFPASVGLKLGVDRFYTTISVAYNTAGGDRWDNYLAIGFGIGSIIPIGASFFFNPELMNFTPLIHRSGVHQLVSFTPLAGFNINRHFSITAGPSVTWSRVSGNVDTPMEHLFSIMTHEINDRHSIVVGARASLRLRF